MTERLRIAQIAPIDNPVAPETTSSIEHLVYLLTEELVRRGHAVTLFATGDSRTSAALRSVYARGSEQNPEMWNWEFHQSIHAAAAFERACEFDVIHSHDYQFALPFTRMVRTPSAHTQHTLLDPDIVQGFARRPEARLVAISEYQRSRFAGIANVPVVHNGIDIDAFPFSPTRGDYLLYLGRMIGDKGPQEAIRIAQRVGMRLVLAGPESEFYHAQLAPLVDGRTVDYVGPVRGAERNALLAGAAALLYPLLVSETFGLVLVEAMACGTPVAALARGAVPEIVEDGVTGYAACDVESLIALLPAVLALDRDRVRQAAETLFHYRRMVDDYERLYREMVDQAERRPA